MGNCIDRKNTPPAYEVLYWMQMSVQNWCESQVEKSHRPHDSCLPVELILVSCKGDLEGTQLNTRSSPIGDAAKLDGGSRARSTKSLFILLRDPPPPDPLLGISP